MLTKFMLRNYKNFKDTIEFDFGKVGGYKFNTDCIRDNVITKSIIYGCNATGKTNLGRAMGDIVEVLTPSGVLSRNFKILNADSNEKYAFFTYEFLLKNRKVVYNYTKNENNDLCSENLILDDNCIFNVDLESGYINEKELKLELIGVENINLKKYIELIKQNSDNIESEDIYQIPFLRYILSNTVLPQNSVINLLYNFVRRMRFFSVAQHIRIASRSSRMLESFNDYLGERNNLLDFENFLNVMGVSCKLRTIRNIEGHFELFFDYEKPVPFYENASSGTISLVNFYRRYVAQYIAPSFIYMDEFDAFYHYEMAEKMVKYFKEKYKDCQVIMTTHNTNLMTNHLMRPDCLFILSRNGKITPLCDATERELREGHNLEKMYIGGEFEKYE